MDKDILVSPNPKKNGITTLISDRTDFGQKALMVIFKDHNIMIKISIEQEEKKSKFSI